MALHIAPPHNETQHSPLYEHRQPYIRKIYKIQVLMTHSKTHVAARTRLCFYAYLHRV